MSKGKEKRTAPCLRRKKPFGDWKEGQEETRKKLGGKGNSCYRTNREMTPEPGLPHVKWEMEVGGTEINKYTINKYTVDDLAVRREADATS